MVSNVFASVISVCFAAYFTLTLCIFYVQNSPSEIQKILVFIIVGYVE